MPNDRFLYDNQQAMILNVLHSHPGVREAAMTYSAYDGLAAFIVPDDSFLDNVMGRETSAAHAVSKWRKTSDLSQLTKGESPPVGFNTLGWNSSYTRQPIPAEMMVEWVETTVAEILHLKPKSIYEIGCGTGMLLMRIAPCLDRYVAIDFSPVVLERLKMQLRTLPSVASKVEVLERMAETFDDVEEKSFDAVVLNSIVQYFPNALYLTRVLNKAIDAVKPGGHVFIGDIRNLALLPPFACSVETFQAANDLKIEDLRSRVRRRIEREQEEVISPAYFVSLQRRHSKVSRLEIRPRIGRTDNEMTRYRYNAILHVGSDTGGAQDRDFYDWEQRGWTLDDVRSMLRRHPRECLGIMNIKNARIEQDLATLAALNDADAPHTVGDLRQKLKRNILDGIHPQALADLSTEGLGFGVYFSWAACRPDGSFDAYFVPTELHRPITMPEIGWPEPKSAAFVRMTNAPGQCKIRKELVSQLFAYCRQNLPEHLIPRRIELVDTVARGPDGNVDSSALIAEIAIAG